MIDSALRDMKENYGAIIQCDTRFTKAYDLWCALRFWKSESDLQADLPNPSQFPILDSTDFRNEIRRLTKENQTRIPEEEQLRNLKLSVSQNLKK